MSAALHQKMKQGLITVLYDIIPPSPGVNIRARAADVLVENMRYLGSYTRTDDAEPTILVPGSPRIWTDRAVPFELKFTDQKAAMHKCRPHDAREPTGFAPLFAALDAQEACVLWSSLDMILDRATLCNLLAWVSRRADGLAFRIDLQPVGNNTVLYNRWDGLDTQALTVYQPGYGISFEEEGTKTPSACEGGTSHHRIIQYDFCGLKLVVRFEVDACLLADERKYVNPLQSPVINGDGKTLKGDSYGMDIKVVHAGAPVPQHALLELKCLHAQNDNPRWINVMPQMYFSATPRLYRGLRMKAACVKVEKRLIDPVAVFQMLPGLTTELWQLGVLLHQLQYVALTTGRFVPLSIVGYKGQLRAYERTGENSGTWMLPEEEKKRFGQETASVGTRRARPWPGIGQTSSLGRFCQAGLVCIFYFFFAIGIYTAYTHYVAPTSES